MTTYYGTTPYSVSDRYSDLEVTHASPSQPRAQGLGPSIPTTVYSEKDQHKTLGLGKWPLVALVATVAALVVGAAVGGGLGAALVSCQNHKDSYASDACTTTDQSPTIISPSGTTTIRHSTVTATSTVKVTATATAPALSNYAIAPPSSVYSVSFDCPELAKTLQATVYNQYHPSEKYKIYCGVDFNTVASMESDGDLPIHDLLGVISYNVQTCLEACSSLNRFATINGLALSARCRSIMFTSRMQSALSEQEANCFLKNGIPWSISSLPVVRDSGVYTIMSAALQEDEEDD